ncbi:MAG: hypothetical protein ACFCVK_22965 [Acidimicrobiales bacterium]
MVRILAGALVMGLALVMAVVVVWSFSQQRQLRASKVRQANTGLMNGVTHRDLVNVTRAVARLQCAHDAARDRLGGLERERDDLKDEMAWLLGELALRPEPHPVVRFLHAHGPQSATGLRHHLGPVELGELQALIDSHQITKVDGCPETAGCRYRFVPHHQRPNANPKLAPLNRYLALLVTAPSAADHPTAPLTLATPATGDAVLAELMVGEAVDGHSVVA